MTGESIALLVAVLWTTGAIFGELASKRLGALPLNVIRMALSLLMLGLALWFMTGHPYPHLADTETWTWMTLSGLMGFGLGDYCLFTSYVLIGSRFSQLLMTLASPFAALTAWLLLGEQMSPLGLLGMTVTLLGIGMSVMNRSGEKREERRERRERNDKGGEWSVESGERNVLDLQNNTQGTKVSSLLSPLSSLHQKHSPLSSLLSLLSSNLKLPPRGIVFGIGAALGQGVGLVLSKVGLEHYTASAPQAEGLSAFAFPVGGTMIRALAGLACFLLLLILKGKTHRLATAVRDRRGMTYALLATFLGPALGVSLSLLALQYTQAGVAQTLMSLVPILIILPSRLLFKTKVTALEVVGAVIAVLGVTLFFI